MTGASLLSVLQVVSQ